jgi:hypothetical protein
VPEVSLFAAYTFIEALNDTDSQADLRWNLRVGEPGRKPTAEQKAENATFAHWSSLLMLLVKGHWLPRLVTTQTIETVNAVLGSRPIVLSFTPFGRNSQQFCTGRTVGVTNDLRDRIVYDYGKLYHNPSQPMPIALYEELAREGIVDWVINSTRHNYEVRKCAWDGLWFEPKLGGRSRFCEARCRQDFNNARVGKTTGLFHCYKCRDDRPIEDFSGLGLSDNPFDENDARSTPLTFTSIQGSSGIYGGDRICLSCVRQYFPEWSRYIAPIANRQAPEAQL